MVLVVSGPDLAKSLGFKISILKKKKKSTHIHRILKAENRKLKTRRSAHSVNHYMNSCIVFTGIFCEIIRSYTIVSFYLMYFCGFLVLWKLKYWITHSHTIYSIMNYVYLCMCEPHEGWNI